MATEVIFEALSQLYISCIVNLEGSADRDFCAYRIDSL